MRYKIGDIAYLLSLSTESLRHYEKSGIIHPTKDEETAYRYYDAWDLTLLGASRHHRALGFSLEESAQMIGRENPKEVFSDLKNRESEIEAEIARQSQMLRAIRAWRKEAESSYALIDQFELETRVATYFLPYQHENELISNKRQQRAVRECFMRVPYVYTGMLLGMQPGGGFTVGLCLSKAGADQLNIPLSDAYTLLPERLCAHTAFLFHADTFDPDLPRHAMQARLLEKGLQADGDILCRFNIVFQSQEGVSGVLDCLLPIR